MESLRMAQAIGELERAQDSLRSAEWDLEMALLSELPVRWREWLSARAQVHHFNALVAQVRDEESRAV
jgi:hypothetical protein